MSEQHWVHKHVMLEAFFRAKNCYDDPVFTRLLKERASVDLRKPPATYERWQAQAVTALMVEYYYPNLTPEDAQFQVGHAVFDGYCKTITGRVLFAGLGFDFVQPDFILKIALKALNDGDSNSVRQLVKNNSSSYSFIFRKDPLNPHVSHGLLQNLAERLRRPEATASLLPLSPLNYDIEISWKETP